MDDKLKSKSKDTKPSISSLEPTMETPPQHPFMESTTLGTHESIIIPSLKVDPISLLLETQQQMAQLLLQLNTSNAKKQHQSS